MTLEGRVAIVTGASAGIGQAYCLALAAEGAITIAAARTLGDLATLSPARGTLAETLQLSKGLPGTVVPMVCDVANEASIVALTETVIDRFGRIDILVNNAGVYPHHEPLEVDAATWDATFDVNLRGAFLMQRHLAPHMIRQGSGSIINMTSRAGEPTRKGQTVHEGLMLYCISKAGLNRLTLYMAEELRAHGVAVNALSPGGVVTDTWSQVAPERVEEAKKSGFAKPCTPEVLGPALIYLAQQTAATMTGCIVHNDEFGRTWPDAPA